MAKTNLNFHQTFKPERQYLSSLLAELPYCSGLDIQEISNQTGIPTGKSSGKVAPTISYAEYMGLIKKEGNDLSYTELGECIKDEDAALLEKLTLLLLHSMIVRPYSGAELWAHVFNNVFPKYRNQLTIKQFEKEIEIAFGEGVKTAPFNGTYQDLLAPLNLLSTGAEQMTLNSQRIDPDYVYLYAFVLFTYWDEWISNTSNEKAGTASENEITADHLKEIGFRNPFGWDDKEEYKALELMTEKGLIVLNRQMVPFAIRRGSDIDSTIELLYSELC